jgi:hypothetical protein
LASKSSNRQVGAREELAWITDQITVTIDIVARTKAVTEPLPSATP